MSMMKDRMRSFRKVSVVMPRRSAVYIAVPAENSRSVSADKGGAGRKRWDTLAPVPVRDAESGVSGTGTGADTASEI